MYIYWLYFAAFVKDVIIGILFLSLTGVTTVFCCQRKKRYIIKIRTIGFFYIYFRQRLIAFSWFLYTEKKNIQAF